MAFFDSICPGAPPAVRFNAFNEPSHCPDAGTISVALVVQKPANTPAGTYVFAMGGDYSTAP